MDDIAIGIICLYVLWYRHHFILIAMDLHLYSPGLRRIRATRDIFLSWKDERSPMLVKNSETEERRRTHATRDTLLSWKDELSFPMLVKNDQTGERNVLCLNHLEVENVPDVSPI